MLPMNPIVEVLPDPTAVAQRSLEIVLSKFHTAIAERGRFTIALSGGSTPQTLYRAIATQDLPWDKIHVFWGDERYVPPGHVDSNQRMARQAWLDRVTIPAENIHPMPTVAADPAVSAQAYETELQTFFAVQPGDMPTLDLVLLGMGDDGHTASLFPHTPALQVHNRCVTAGDKDGQPRLTLTAPLINQARCVLFMVAGANKQSALRQVFTADASDITYPAKLIRPAGELWWLLDQAAAAGLEH